MKRFIKAIIRSIFNIPVLRRVVEASSDIGRQKFLENPDRYLTPVTVRIGDNDARFYPFGGIPQWRYSTLMTKEEETIEWIDSMPSDSVFWDVGANVGVYSVYAALRRGARVVSFEPSAVNYFVLNRNIHLNKLDDRIHAYPLAICESRRLGAFNMHSLDPGAAMFHFGDKTETISAGHETVTVQFRQSMIGYGIDEFVADFRPPFPNFLKVDVDGIEDEIVRGAMATLKNEQLRSVLIELDDANAAQRDSVVEILEGLGLRLKAKKHSPMFNSGKFATIYNHIFSRD